MAGNTNTTTSAVVLLEEKLDIQAKIKANTLKVSAFISILLQISLDFRRPENFIQLHRMIQ